MPGRPKKIKPEIIEIEKEIKCNCDEKDTEILVIKLEKEILEIKELLGQATAEGRGLVGVYEAIDAINNRLVDLDRLEEKVNSFIQKIEQIHENRGCHL